MLIDYLENILHFLTVLTALLISLFCYVGSKERAWLASVGIFIGYFLSSYFWTAHLVIMGEQPVVSDILTNFGWNMSFFLFILLLLHTKSREERRYFHPVMLLPIPLNIWQLTLYLDFGGIVNSVYQVTVCTAVACLCLQSIMWYLKNRKNVAEPPLIAAAVLLCITCEFGMWTSTCFDGWVYDLYYPFTFIECAVFLLITAAIGRTYRHSGESAEMHISKGIQNIIKVSYFAIVLIGSVGGVMLGSWIRDVLSEGVSGFSEETSVYDIIPVILFLTSIVLVTFAIVVILVVNFEQKIAENNSLREARRAAEQSNAAKSEFLANMSHEIRTPINAVLGMNKMIMRESLRARRLPPDSHDKAFADITGYSANIESAGNNLLAIINDILDFSKIEAGKFDITEREYMLSSVLNDVSNTILFRAKDKGLEYRVSTDADLPDRLYGDEVRIRQIISNILGNAVKYTDKGSVTLSVYGGGKEAYEAGKTLELIITVKDTGIGIKKEDLGRIFEKFERMELERNSTVEGTGLGLSITHRLLAMMNGTISVESEYGEGSVFTIRIPQKIVSPEPIGNFRTKFEKSIEENAASDYIFRAPDANILIVDDTRMNLTVAVGLLADTGIKSDTAESGAKALELAAANSYDVILLDQRMPEMDGTATLHRLRGMERCADTPVICLTADAISGARERYVREGFTDYISKPIDSRELKNMLMKYLPQEKVIPVSGDDEQQTAASPAETGTLYGALNAAGIDTAQGLIYCQNSTQLYLTLLSEYAKSADEKSAKMREYYGAGDMKGYATLVHSLKSTSKTIGAVKISETAAMLEKAADSGDTELVRNEHEGLLEEYRKTVGAISSAVSGETIPEPDDDDEIMEFMPK